MQTITFSNGCLGSHNDEERSEMRYVMRIAQPASHQNFERNLHFLSWGVCLLECLCTLPYDNLRVVQSACFLAFVQGKSAQIVAVSTAKSPELLAHSYSFRLLNSVARQVVELSMVESRRAAGKL
jgi:hypothetical protein